MEQVTCLLVKVQVAQVKLGFEKSCHHFGWQPHGWCHWLLADQTVPTLNTIMTSHH